MDPNLPPVLNPKISNKRNLIILVVITIIIIILSLAFLFPNLFKNNFKKAPQADSQAINPNPTPIPSPISLKINQGTVSSITKDKITITSNSATSEFIIDNLTVVGTKNKRVTLEDVKVGQEASITTLEGSNSARLILILK